MNAMWSPAGKPVAPSSAPVERNPEQEPPADAGAQVEGWTNASVDSTAPTIFLSQEIGRAQESLRQAFSTQALTDGLLGLNRK